MSFIFFLLLDGYCVNVVEIWEGNKFIRLLRLIVFCGGCIFGVGLILEVVVWFLGVWVVFGFWLGLFFFCIVVIVCL